VTEADRTDRQVRSTSFGSAAEDYGRYRPAPPAEAAEWAVGDSTGRVIDLAAGTGNLSRHLQSTGDGVVAVDIDPRMLEVLGRRLPAVERVAARGEQLPFSDGAAGAVVISSAWHWLDHERAWPEIARVIRPGGSFAVLWSGPDRSVEWVAAVLGHRRDGDRRDGDRGNDGRGNDGRGFRRWQIEVPPGVPFSNIEARTFEATMPYEVADLPGLVSSYSGVIVLPPEQQRTVRDWVVAEVAARPELAGRTTVEMPLRCRVWRSVRTS
jgi:SAM-dependent methyltransferase